MTIRSVTWREQLEAWALPVDLLAAVDESPYGWPQQLWKARGALALEGESRTPTTERVLELAGRAGTVLDIGAGTGRASFPLVLLGHPITMVEQNPSMLASLRELAEGLPVIVVEGRWPDVRDQVPEHDVAMCAHVVYDVSDLVPFLTALDRSAMAGVVIEMTPTHPWSFLRELYREFHGLERPDGPSAEDLIGVVREIGREANVDEWKRPSDMMFESFDQIVELTGRRLVLPRPRWPELAARLRPMVIGEPGELRVGPLEREITTVWWRTDR